MKLLFVFITILFPVYLNAQWEVQYIHADQETRIEVVNQDTILAITGGGGRVHRSFDGGNSWQFSQTIFESSWFNNIHFPSSNIGYITGGTAFGTHGSILAKTTDAGITWDSLTSNAFGYNLINLHFIDNDTGFITGDAGLLLKTTDGGQTLITQPSFPYNTYQCGDIEFTTDQTGYLTITENIGSSDRVYRILKTDDQGGTWNAVYEDTMYNTSGIYHRSISEIQFIDENVGFAVGGNGLFLKTTDGGDTWNVNFLSPYTTLNTVSFVNETTGYVDIAGIIHKTTDGGNIWITQQMITPSIVFDIEMADANIGYAACEGGIYKTLSGGNILGIDDLKGSVRLWPNPASNKLYISSDQVVERITFFDAAGRQIKTFSPSLGELDISDLGKGTYTVVIKLQNEKYVLKFAKI